MTSVAFGYQRESGVGHPSLWVGAYEAAHPALSLHYKNSSCRAPSVEIILQNPAQQQHKHSNSGNNNNNNNNSNREEDNGGTCVSDVSSCSRTRLSSEDTVEVTKPASTKSTRTATTDATTSTSSSAATTPTRASQKNTDQKDTKNSSHEAPTEHPWYALFPTDLAADLVERTKERVQDLLDFSNFLDSRPLEDKVPTLTMDEHIKRGDLLGSGGFAMIYNAEITDPASRRLLLRQNKNRTSSCKGSRQAEYVIKHLSPQLVSQVRKLHIGTRDFLIESHLMATLDHPNILKLVGCTRGGLSNYGITLRTDAFFMVLPKLSCTLTQKLKSWKIESERGRTRHQPPKFFSSSFGSKSSISNNGRTRRSKSFSFPWSTGAKGATRHRLHLLRDPVKEKQQKEFFCRRLQVIIDLLSALEYLHEKRLFHRDIKPDNIGFDTEGCLKLFDFGLAKELPSDEEAMNKDTAKTTSDLTFDFPGNTGTARYMAPEVILREPYNCKVDVFAASILCWEVLSMDRAYISDGVPNGQFFKDCVAVYNDRPHVPKKWSKPLRMIIKQGWIKDISARPTSGQMKQSLQQIMDEQRQSKKPRIAFLRQRSSPL